MILMKIFFHAVGILTDFLSRKGRETVKGDEFTVQGVLDALVFKYGKLLAEELFKDGQLKKDLSIILNGRNILSLENQFQTVLKDGDELVMTPYIPGG